MEAKKKDGGENSAVREIQSIGKLRFALFTLPLAIPTAAATTGHRGGGEDRETAGGRLGNRRDA